MRRILCFLALALALSACATTQTPPPSKPSDPAPQTPTPATPDPVVTPPLTELEPQVQPKPATPQIDSPFTHLPFWQQSDARPALTAFRRSCERWRKKKPTAVFSRIHPEFGYISDWLALCDDLPVMPGEGAAKDFFERHFYPLILGGQGLEVGLVTGYYQPELEARRTRTDVFSEPILAKPIRETDLKRARADITAETARVIAYGRPMDVFFMQIQGSGILAFSDGHKLRAAYAANNGYRYTSIGGVLVRRGEMTKSAASKQAIEEWMRAEGPKAARALMNENKRYIFFAEQKLVSGEGPAGGMQVPLTAMGSLAVDPKEHPYGLPVWINVKLPQSGGDYRGRDSGLLLIAQDTGNAIKGPQRGDIYFGSGFAAGDKAGVMKHRGQWAILMPRSLLRLPPIS